MSEGSQEVSDGVGQSDGVHMAMPCAAAIAQNPALSIAQATLNAGDRQASARISESAQELIKATGLPDQVVQDAIAWQQQDETRSAAELASIDAIDRAHAESPMRKLWGDQSEANVQAPNR